LFLNSQLQEYLTDILKIKYFVPNRKLDRSCEKWRSIT